MADREVTQTGPGVVRADRRRQRWLSTYLGLGIAAMVLSVGTHVGRFVVAGIEVNWLAHVATPLALIVVAGAMLRLTWAGHYRVVVRVMAPILVVANAAALAAAVGGDSDLQLGMSLVFTAFPILFAALFLDTRETIAVALAVLGVLLALPLYSDGPAQGAVVMGIQTVVFFGGTSVLLSHLSRRDLADLREQGEQLDELRARMVVADRLSSLGMVAAAAAHELNNALVPLSVSLWAASDATGAPTPGPELRRALADANEGYGRITQLVGDLTRLGRAVDEGTATTDPALAVESVLRLVSPIVSERARLVVEQGAAPVVRMSGLRLGQIVLNLVQNAAQAFAEPAREGSEVRVRVSATPTGAARIEVQDNGPGMPREVKERALEPFFTTKDPEDGSGLGLYVCAQLARDAGGQIVIDSALGIGTTVAVELPAADPSMAG